MKKEYISFISLFVSIIALAFSLIRCEPMTMDWMNVLVAILGVLTTVLIANQIYDVITIKKIKRDTIVARDETINETNNNLLFIFHGLADFNAIRFLDATNDIEEDEINTFYYGALIYRSMELELSSRLNHFQMFVSAIEQLGELIEDINILTDEQRNDVLNIMLRVQNNMRTDDFIRIINQLRR